jgi:hypothetical protein
MTDPVQAVQRIGETLKAAMEKGPAKYPLRRHHDDKYWDEVVILAGQIVLRGSVVPRYKTSGMSGDEWRISTQLVVKLAGTVIVERGFHDMNGLMTHAPGFIYAERRLFDVPGEAKLVVKRKRIVLCERLFPSFGEAAMGIFWHVITANEGTRDVKWNHLSDVEERGLCQQVGCAEPPVNLYRLKKLMYGNSRRCFLEPEYDFEDRFVWYCARHTTRGDCGFEDAAENMELVEGHGVPRTHEEDESPSVLGGVVEVTLPGKK